VRFWTWKFTAAFALTVLFVLIALPLGLATDPVTGDPAPLLPKLTESGVASFVFLLLVLYTISHAGSWVLAKFRGRSQGPPPEEERRRRKKKQA